MPLYEYRCRSCDQPFEVLVTARGEAVSCPRCQGGDLDRLLGLPAAGRAAAPAANCRGDGPPCGAPLCGRKS